MDYGQKELKIKFHNDMFEIYRRSVEEAKYRPSRLLEMLGSRSEYENGYNAAKQLILTQTEGYIKL